MSGAGVPTGPEVIDGDLVEGIAQRLAPTGLNRCQAIAVDELDDAVWLPGRRPEWALDGPVGRRPDTGADRHHVLLLVGHGGRRLWAHLHDPASGFAFDTTPDPIDTFSITTTEEALDALAPGVDRHLLYPDSECPVDLVALGRALGWQGPSPLGLGIGWTFGLWSAFRALWLLSSPIAPRLPAPDPSVSVCSACETHECVHSCPANAVVHGQDFNLMRCLDHRSKGQSSCAETCLSRWSCPVAVEHRYTLEQMAYHYRLSRPPVEHDRRA